MLKTVMLSALRASALKGSFEDFHDAQPHDWVVWEPGPWKPPAKKQTIKVDAGKAPAGSGESLAMRLRVRAGKKKVTLGREEDNDLVVNDGTLSRTHLAFEQTASGIWLVSDAGSRNGSALNDKPVEAGKLYALKDGDHLQAGQVHLRFHSSEGMFARLKLGW